jgi:hypothetical protein
LGFLFKALDIIFRMGGDPFGTCRGGHTKSLIPDGIPFTFSYDDISFFRFLCVGNFFEGNNNIVATRIGGDCFTAAGPCLITRCRNGKETANTIVTADKGERQSPLFGCRQGELTGFVYNDSFDSGCCYRLFSLCINDFACCPGSNNVMPGKAACREGWQDKNDVNNELSHEKNSGKNEKIILYDKYNLFKLILNDIGGFAGESCGAICSREGLRG